MSSETSLEVQNGALPNQDADLERPSLDIPFFLTLSAVFVATALVSSVQNFDSPVFL